MRYFGRPWGGPAFDGGTQVPTPVGERCIHCDEEVGLDDQGIMTLYFRGDVTEAPEHRECVLRAVLGSVGHQQGQCHCFGGTEEDPPGLSKREAARAAVAYFEKHRFLGKPAPRLFTLEQVERARRVANDADIPRPSIDTNPDWPDEPSEGWWRVFRAALEGKP